MPLGDSADILPIKASWVTSLIFESIPFNATPDTILAKTSSIL